MCIPVSANASPSEDVQTQLDTFTNALSECQAWSLPAETALARAGSSRLPVRWQAAVSKVRGKVQAVIESPSDACIIR